MFTYVGMIVVVLFGIYYVCKVMSVQGKVIEGLTSKKKSQKSVMDLMTEGDVKSLKSAIEKMSDTVLIGKYKSDYEDMLMDFEQVIDYNILLGIVSMSGGVETGGSISTDTLGKIPLINELYSLKTNLNSTMDFLDSQKSGGGLGGLFGGGSKSSSSSSKSKSSSFF